MDDTQARYKYYLDFIAKYPKYFSVKGDYKKGEIEVVTDLSLFPQCEEGSAKLMQESGISNEESVKRARI